MFDSILALTNGGPGTSTAPFNLFMYWTAFYYTDFGYGSSMAVLITGMSLLVTVAVFRSFRGNSALGEG